MLIYLIQVITCSGLLYGYYHCFLRNSRFHRYNRYYLLSAVIISLAVPLLKIPVQVSPENKVLHSFKPLHTINTEIAYTPVTILKTNSVNVSNLVFIITVIVSVILLLRLIIAILKIVKIKATANVTNEREFKFIITEHEAAPFSFFKWLFWNKKMDIQTTAGQQILKHELYHIKMKHSYDTLLQEILLCIFWINPFFYLYRKELKAIHEFLADKYASAGYDAYDYARLLVFQSACGVNNPLVHTFYNSQLKRRIIMLTTSKKPAYRYLRKIMVLPILAIATGLFAFTYKTPVNKVVAAIENFSDYPVVNKQVIVKENIKSVQLAEVVKENKSCIVQPEQQKPVNTIHDTMYYLDGEKITKEKYKSIDRKELSSLQSIKTENGMSICIYRIGNESKAVNRNIISEGVDLLNEVVVIGYEKKADTADAIEKVYTAAEEPPTYTNGSWRKYLERKVNAQIASDNKAPVGIYKALIQFIIEKDGSLSNIQAVSNHGYGIEQEAIRIIKSSAKWNPAKINGEAVRYVYNQPVTFMVDGNLRLLY